MNRRVLVLGGTGYFGSVAVDLLRAGGLSPLVASRRGRGDVAVDVENRESLGGVLRKGDVVIDAAGPFQTRGTALIETAIEVGFDVIDIADSLAYVRQLDGLKDRIASAGIRVFTACSSVSAISAAMIRYCGIEEPRGLTGVLVPATKHTAVKGTAESLFASVGRPVEVFLDCRLVTRQGWQTSRTFALPAPLGRRTGYLFEAADSWTLPARWPSLKRVDWYVDTNVLGLNSVFGLAARSSAMRGLIDRCKPLGLKLARLLGSRRSGVAYQIDRPDGASTLVSLTSADRGHIIPVAPAVLATSALIDGRVPHVGLVPPDRQVDPDELVGYLQKRSIRITKTT